MREAATNHSEFTGTLRDRSILLRLEIGATECCDSLLPLEDDLFNYADRDTSDFLIKHPMLL